MTTEIKKLVRSVLSLKEGEEIVIGKRIFFRIDDDEIKVHNDGTAPDSPESETRFIERSGSEIAYEIGDV